VWLAHSWTFVSLFTYCCLNCRASLCSVFQVISVCLPLWYCRNPVYSGGTLFAVEISTDQFNFATEMRTEILYSRKTLPDSSQEHIANYSPPLVVLVLRLMSVGNLIVMVIKPPCYDRGYPEQHNSTAQSIATETCRVYSFIIHSIFVADRECDSATFSWVWNWNYQISYWKSK
jgi:hypothetical protein